MANISDPYTVNRISTLIYIFSNEAKTTDFYYGLTKLRKRVNRMFESTASL